MTFWTPRGRQFEWFMPPRVLQIVIFYTFSAGFSAWAGQPVPVISTQQPYVRRQYPMWWGFSYIQRNPHDLPCTSFHLLWCTFLMCLKVQTPFLVPCNTIIMALQDSSFPHQQINFITCLVEIPSLCTFTSRSLVTAVSTVSEEFRRVLTDIQASAGLPNLCAHKQNQSLRRAEHPSHCYGCFQN